MFPAMALGQGRVPEEFLGDLFFPGSADWLKFADLPALSKGDWLERLPDLRAALPPDEGCVQERVLDPDDKYETAAYFRVLDVNKDGVEDILYSHDAYCAEGGLHIIWYGDGQGAYTITENNFAHSHLLKLKPAARSPLKVTYEPGCCGDFVSNYYQDSPEEARKHKGAAMPRGDAIYSTLQKAPLREEIVIFAWTELRESPETKDEYDFGFSEAMGYVAVGNILSIVWQHPPEPPCTGTLLSYDESGEWALLVMDEPCGESLELSYSRGDFIRVGWVDKRAFKFASAEKE